MSDETLPEPIDRSEPITLDDIQAIAAQQSPVKQVEGAFSDFVRDSFDIVRCRDNQTQKALQALVDKLPEMDADQLIAAVQVLTTNDNDLVGRIMAPLSSLLTTSLHNEMEDRREREKIAQSAGGTKNVIARAGESGNGNLVGADQFQKLLSIMASVNAQMPEKKKDEN